MSLKMRYDREDDVLMIWFAQDKPVDHAEQSGQSILHLGPNGEPILLEILNAQDFVPELVRTVMGAHPPEAVSGTPK
ncbi:MAG: DUF2283 domain-containing protein [Anaerolineae bacterium]|nr:DUF2283 domain-containing protein [Anaerolineae bacterium]